MSNKNETTACAVITKTISKIQRDESWDMKQFIGNELRWVEKDWRKYLNGFMNGGDARWGKIVVKYFISYHLMCIMQRKQLILHPQLQWFRTFKLTNVKEPGTLRWTFGFVVVHGARLKLGVLSKTKRSNSVSVMVVYLLSAGLAAAALPAVTQTITTASVLVGLNVLFRPARVYQRSAPLTLPLHESRNCRGGSRRRRRSVWSAHRVQSSFFFTACWPLFTTLGFLNDFLQNEESILCLSCLLDNTFHHFLLVTHGSVEIQFQHILQ